MRPSSPNLNQQRKIRVFVSRLFSCQISHVRVAEIEYVDSSAQLWAVVFKEGEKYDKTLVESWKGDMDGILFFVRSFILSLPCQSTRESFGRRAFSLQLSQRLS